MTAALRGSAPLGRWLWLPAAACCAYLSAVDSPIALTAWLGPVFLLRFTRSHGAVAGFLASLLAMTAATYLAARTMAPLPVFVLVLLLSVGNALSLFAYLADHFVHRRLPPILASLVLPLGWSQRKSRKRP
jgi:apolipoprotein N-acyltransferase